MVGFSPPPPPHTHTQARSEQHAREVCTYRDQQGRRREQLRALRRHSTAATKEEEKEGGDGGDIMNIPLVVKGDVAGSVEALVELLKSRQPEAVRVSVIHSGVGPISDSDIEMAASSNGLILGFNVTQNKVTAALAKQREVKILSHNVIYKLLELLKVRTTILSSNHTHVHVAASWYYLLQLAQSYIHCD